jgi:hypothetical protein
VKDARKAHERNIMDVKVTSTGKVFYQVDNAVAAMLMEAFPASFERADARPAPAAPVAQWGIGTTLNGFAFVKWTMQARTEFYDGPPPGLTAYFQKMGYSVPAGIVERYTSAWAPRPVALSQEE